MVVGCHPTYLARAPLCHWRVLVHPNLQVTAEPPPSVPFNSPRDGVDIYCDALRFLPACVLLSKVQLKVIDHEFRVYGDAVDYVPELDSPASCPKLAARYAIPLARQTLAPSYCVLDSGLNFETSPCRPLPRSSFALTALMRSRATLSYATQSLCTHVTWSPLM